MAEAALTIFFHLPLCSLLLTILLNESFCRKSRPLIQQVTIEMQMISNY